MSITKLRIERGISKAQLSKELGVSVRTIFRWEKDTMSMTLKNAVMVAEFFNISIEGLITKEKRGGVCYRRH